MRVKPRQAVRKNVDLRLARPPKRQQLRAVGRPVGAHPVSDERREIGADAVAVPAVAEHCVLNHAGQQFVALVGSD